MDNILLLTDSYKLTHARQYPEGTTRVFSYMESRGGESPETVFFGLQYVVNRYLKGQVVTQEKIDEAREVVNAHLGPGHFNEAGWLHILNDHNGELPLSIHAVPEGTVVPTGNVLMTMQNTCDKCHWVTNYMETLLMQLWYPITVATLSRRMKKLIGKFMAETGGSIAGLEFKLHDFGFRGVSSVESAAIGGLAHLVNFKGSDTVAALVAGRNHYDEPMAGFSIPASEHSTMTSWGGPLGESAAMANMLKLYPTGLVACVSDSYDIYRACERIWGSELKQQVLARDGCLVIRPDSGDPLEVLPKVLDILGHNFGYTTNFLGYKVLNPKVRVIQGDGVDFEACAAILTTLKKAGWAADNLAFGMGGALLQKLNRDTQKFAIKCSYIEVDGKGREVYKQPVTAAFKKSKAGKLALVKSTTGIYDTVSYTSKRPEGDLLVEVFRDGRKLRHTSLSTVRELAAI